MMHIDCVFWLQQVQIWKQTNEKLGADDSLQSQQLQHLSFCQYLAVCLNKMPLGVLCKLPDIRNCAFSYIKFHFINLFLRTQELYSNIAKFLEILPLKFWNDSFLQTFPKYVTLKLLNIC